MALLKRTDIERYIMTMLGYPVVAVELAPEQLAMAISIAVQEYQSVGQVERDYIEIPSGSAPDPNHPNKFPLPPEVGSVCGVVFSLPFQTMVGSVADIFSYAAYSFPYGINLVNMSHAAGNLAVYYQHMQDRMRLLGNEITFKVIDNDLYVFPEPKGADKIIVEYTKNPYEEGDSTVSVSNTYGQTWIKQFALAIAKGMLAQVRGKYSQISAGPEESQSLNSADLQQQSIQEMQQLREQLEGHRTDTQFYLA